MSLWNSACILSWECFLSVLQYLREQPRESLRAFDHFKVSSCLPSSGFHFVLTETWQSREFVCRNAPSLFLCMRGRFPGSASWEELVFHLGLGHCDLRCTVISKQLSPHHHCEGSKWGNAFTRPCTRKGKFLFVLLCQPTVCCWEVTSYSSASVHLSTRKGR